MSRSIVKVVERVIARAPQWIRQDLTSADPSCRSRAEEALAAMIAAALERLGGSADTVGSVTIS